MSLREEIDTLVKACCTGIWLVSTEPAEAQKEIESLAKECGDFALYSWDAHQGVRPVIPAPGVQVPANAKAPQAAVEFLEILSKSSPHFKVLLLHNFHRFLHLPDVLQGTANRLQAGKLTGTFGVVVSPATQIPVEVRTYFTQVQHELPTKEELRELLYDLFPEHLTDQAGVRTPVPDAALDAAAGLTRYEAENAYSVASVRTGKILESRPVWEYKARTLAKGGVLSLYKGEEGFDSLGGLESVKDFCRKALAPRANRKTVAKGIIALGVPGSGKSQLAKALGVETNRPTAVVDIAGLLSKYVGESEANLKQVLMTLEAMSPCVAFLDEIEKGLSGVGSGLDSGVMDRIFGTLLSWRQDTKADVFLVATSNDVSKMPAPLVRAGRTNAIFFFDLPTRAEKDAIWDMYLKHYGLETECLGEKVPLPDDTDWTGAEIRNACELSDLLGIPLRDAARMVVPIATTQAGQIDELRGWAENRVLSASHAGVYHRSVNAEKKPQKRRALKNPPESLN